MLARCLDSLAQTAYRNYEVVVVDNESDDPATCDYLAGLSHRVLRVANPGPRFSFAHVNNVAARAVDAEYLLFLNDDTEVRDPRWLSAMMGYAQLPGVGAVGARLVYPDGRVQHAGILHGYYDGLPGPAFKLAAETEHGYLSYLAVARNYGAVTAACMLTPRRVFLEHGGFDGERFAVAYNDVDYGFRLEAAGLRCVYAPDATLLHHEGRSRGFTDDPRETAAYRAQWGARRERYYNPNLSFADERFALLPRRAFVAAPPGPVRALMCAFNLNWEGAPYSQFEMTAELKRRRIVEPVVYSPVDGPLRAAYEREGISVHVATHPLAGVTTDVDYEAAVAAFARWIRTLDVDVVYGNTLQTFYAIDAAHRVGRPSVWNPRESEPWQDYFRQYPDAVALRALRCYALSLPDRVRRPRDRRRLGRARYPPQLHRHPQRPRPPAPAGGRGRTRPCRRRGARSASVRTIWYCFCSAPSASARASTISRRRSRSCPGRWRPARARSSSATARANTSERCTR